MTAKDGNKHRPNQRLRHAREARGWSQQELADHIGAPRHFMVSRWESGAIAPSPSYRKKLCELFGLSAQELGLVRESKERMQFASSSTDPIGRQLGNYQLLRLLGQGGFAAVYLGEHVSLRSHAALKILHTRLDEEDAAHFVQEARILAHLSHPHIVRVLDFAVQDGIPFLVMEYAPGGTLRTLHPKGTRVPLELIVTYVIQVASALQYAHDQRLLHRDIKPENMLLGTHFQVLLSDFGLALLTTQALSESTQAMAQPPVGTFPYLAPEQLQGKPGPASDQYAFGAMVYEWITGRPPFGGSWLEIAMQHLSVPPPPLRTLLPELSPAIEDIVLRALAKGPTERFASVEAFALALEEACREDASRKTLSIQAAGSLAQARTRVPSLSPLPTGTVTLLFADIEGMLYQPGDRYASVLSECQQLLRAASHEFQGHVVDTQGDACFVVFARATDAVRAAVAAQCALVRHSWPQGVVVGMRMGLHTGEPELSPEGYSGVDVHHAAWIMRAGHGGQILLSRTTSELVKYDLPEGINLLDVGEHRLKDGQQPCHLFQVVAEGSPADFPALKTLGIALNNFPVQPTLFMRREQELTIIAELLYREDVHLVTLTGLGGVGKTRLGLQVSVQMSDRFPDGIFFVDLAPLSDPEFVLPAIAQVLNVKLPGDQSLLNFLKVFLREKQMLLLLDNFEQVISAALPVAELLTACPKLKMLVTSRAALRVRAEHAFLVPPLALPDLKRLPDLVTFSQYEAVALFIQRTQAVKTDFQVTAANAPAVAEICVRLDGLPLAIELAAARIKFLPPQALLARLDRQLLLLIGGGQDMPVRQQTLRNTIAWSYNLLTTQEQQLFQILSIFAGGCTLEALESLYGTLGGSNETGTILEGVTSLHDKSLVQQREQVGEPRLVLLETLREYGMEMLETSGRRETTQQAYVMYYLALAEQAEGEMVGPQEVVWLDRLEQEHDNVREVLLWLLEQKPGEQQEHSIKLALRLGGALRHFWIIHASVIEGKKLLARALAASERMMTVERAKALIAAADLAMAQNDVQQGELLAGEALLLCQQIGDQFGRAFAFYILGAIATYKGEYTKGHALLEESAALSQAIGFKERFGWAIYMLGWAEMVQGDTEAACARHKKALMLFREMGFKSGISLASVMWAQDLTYLTEDFETARTLLHEAIPILEELGNTWGIALASLNLGEIALRQSDTTAIRFHAEKAFALSKEMDHKEYMASALSLMAHVEMSQGNVLMARRLYEDEVIPLTLAVDSKGRLPYRLEALAEVAAAQGNVIWAIRLLGAAETILETLDAPILRAGYQRVGYQQVVATARAQLSEKAFATAWDEGKTMSLEHVLAAGETSAVSSSHSLKTPSSPPVSVPALPAGLTQREVEVLCLVAQGMTDAQVAKQLIISSRTVNWHLTSIYSKLQVTSRSAATRYAIEHQLI